MPKQSQKLIGLKNQVYYPGKDHILASKLLKVLSKYPFSSTAVLSEKCTMRDYAYSQKRILITLSRLKEMDYCSEYATVSRKEHVCNFCEKSTRYFVERNSLDGSIEILDENKIKREKAKKNKDYDPKHWFHCKVGYVLGRLVWLQCFNCEKHIDSKNDDEYKMGSYRYWSLSQNGKFVMLALLQSSPQYDFIKQNNQNEIFRLLDILLHSQKKEIVTRLIYKIKQNIRIDPKLNNVVQNWYQDILPTIQKLNVSKDLPLYEYQKEIKMEILRTVIGRSNRHE